MKNYINKKYNRLTILTDVGKDEHYMRQVLCKCECGNFTVQRLSNVISEKVKSCGCYRKDRYRIHKQLLWNHF
ncbi:MAG: hypothetical protein WC414_04310 [Patescibacteria group bacterium]